jgi:HEAT repeat protein
MPEKTYAKIRELLASSDIAELKAGLELVKAEIRRIGSAQAQELFEVVSSLFYLDSYEQPALAPIVDEAITLVIGFGRWVIPALVEKLDAGDFKAQFAVSAALGRIGADAIDPLLDACAAAPESDRHVFILYALGKIKSPKVIAAVPAVLTAAASTYAEVRDTATRALGKLAESIPPADLTESQRRAIVTRLHANLADTSPAIRAKAVRSLGKLARHGHLTAEEKIALRKLCVGLLGTDEAHDWDHAYVVRREAEEALRYA